MRLPEMRYASGIKKTQQMKFAGLNHNLSASDGELYNMRNLTSDDYPLLASRRPRLKTGTLTAPGGIFGREKLCWVENGSFVYDGQVRGTVSEGEKNFAALGEYLVILPDKAYYNTATGEFGSMESSWSGTASFGNGTYFEEEAEANAITGEGVVWSDFFKAGDAVTISGCTEHPENNKTIIIRQIEGDKLLFYENSFVIGDGEGYTESGRITIARTVPDLIFCCENENRLWGCDGTTVYASKLGDIFNFNVMDGLDTDAWSVDAGSEGAFTGCISYRGYPIFFKENRIYKVYGSLPSNFELTGTATLGLAAGSERSLAVAGETLFYLSGSGIVAYTGGIPQVIGTPLGRARFKNAAAGSDGLKYYVSMESEGEWALYVYDTQTGLWMREDETHATHFIRVGGILYFLNAAGEIWITGQAQSPLQGEKEKAVEWEAEFADFTDESLNKKGVCKLQIRLELEVGARVEVWIQFDSDGRWIRVSGAQGESEKRSYYLPVIPRRSDHYKIKLTGRGGCRVYSMARELYSGSEFKSRRN